MELEVCQCAYNLMASLMNKDSLVLALAGLSPRCGGEAVKVADIPLPLSVSSFVKWTIAHTRT